MSCDGVFDTLTKENCPQLILGNRYAYLAGKFAQTPLIGTRVTQHTVTILFAIIIMCYTKLEFIRSPCGDEYNDPSSPFFRQFPFFPPSHTTIQLCLLLIKTVTEEGSGGLCHLRYFQR